MSALLQLEVRPAPSSDDTKAQLFQFEVSDFQLAMTVHNFICAKNDGREPTLYLVGDDGGELVLNNRLEYERALRAMKEQRAGGGLVFPGPFGPTGPFG